MERTLYHFPLDPASRQARLALGEKRLVFEAVTVRYWEEPADFTKLNPSGLTPVLVEAEAGRRVVICEARAVLEYLEEQHPTPALLGRDAAERAETRRLMQWFDRKFDAEVNGYLLREKLEKRLTKMGAPDLSNMRLGREALRAHLSYMEKLLQARDWLAGPRLTLADFAAAAHISVLDYFGDMPWRDVAAVKTWYMKVKSRPGFPSAAGRPLARPGAGGPL